jgi:hypothetical protein
MRSNLEFRTFAAILTLVLGIIAAAPTQGTAQATQPTPDTALLIGADYSWIHTNIVPGCNCVGLNGGGLQMEARFLSHLAGLADLNITHAANITPDHYALTQTTYGFGMRYLPLSSHARFQPFGEALVGGAYASGTLSPARTGYGQATALAVQGGGGVRIPLGHRYFGGRFLVEPARVDYLYTTFHNGVANRQNDIRISAGLLVRLGQKLPTER